MSTNKLMEYELVREIGQGGFGQVSLYRHRGDNKQYVIKRMRINSDELRKFAEMEVKLLIAIKHPNVVAYRDSVSAKDCMFLIMEYCDSGDLSHKIRECARTKKRLPEKQIIDWTLDMCLALEHIHSLNILHRDLKPQNIFLTSQNVAKIGDFGISRELNPGDQAQTIIGTPLYVSPEIYKGKPYDNKVDVWSLGCIIYEMMTLEPAVMTRLLVDFGIQAVGVMPSSSLFDTQLPVLVKSILNVDPRQRPTIVKILDTEPIKSAQVERRNGKDNGLSHPMNGTGDNRPKSAYSPAAVEIKAPPQPAKQPQQPLPSPRPESTPASPKRPAAAAPARPVSKISELLPMSANPLKKKDKDDIVAKFNKGGFGEIFIHLDKADKKQYVVKKMQTDSDESCQLAETQVRHLSEMKHPNVVAFRDYIKSKDSMFIVTEYCDGGDLESKIKECIPDKSYLSQDQVTQWTLDLSLAVQHIHSLNIVHRDLRPANILLTSQNSAKIGNFECSIRLKPGEQASTKVGLPLYMSPEMFKNQSYNNKVDIWSLGCCLFEMMKLEPALNQGLLEKGTQSVNRMPSVALYGTQLTALAGLMLITEPRYRISIDEVLEKEFLRTARAQRESAAASSVQQNGRRPSSSPAVESPKNGIPEQQKARKNSVAAAPEPKSKEQTKNNGVPVSPRHDAVAPARPTSSIWDALPRSKNPLTFTDRYEILKKYGEGEFGDVVVYTGKLDKKQYSVKKLAIDCDEMRKFTETEVKLLMDIEHPNIIAYRDCIKDKDAVFIVMEYCDGGDLASRIKEYADAKKKLSEEQIIQWTLDLCLALQHVHSLNIIHRDLRPKNVFLTSQNTAKMGNFGHSRLLEPGDLATTALETSIYVSPEVRKGLPYDNKVDVWSLGCCVYEMMALVPPPASKSAFGSFFSQLKGKTQWSSGYSKQLASLTGTMLTKKVDERPTVDEILDSQLMKDAVLQREDGSIIPSSPAPMTATVRFSSVPAPSPSPAANIIQIKNDQVMEPVKEAANALSCSKCNAKLTGQYINRDDKQYCLKCFELLLANKCAKCNEPIGAGNKDLLLKDKHYHEKCFKCQKCKSLLSDGRAFPTDDKIYCSDCHDKLFAPRCDACNKTFPSGTNRYLFKDKKFHEECFRCKKCRQKLRDNPYMPHDQEAVCVPCYEKHYATRCTKCNGMIKSGGITYKEKPWHRDCLTCDGCKKMLAGQEFFSSDEKPYCAECYTERFGKKCARCTKPISGIGETKFISFNERPYHKDCFQCYKCKASLVGRSGIPSGDDVVCTDCHRSS